MAAVERILLGRRVAAVEDDTLRRDLIQWPQKIDERSKIQDEDCATFVQLVTRFLSRNASLLQLLNE